MDWNDDARGVDAVKEDAPPVESDSVSCFDEQ